MVKHELQQCFRRNVTFSINTMEQQKVNYLALEHATISKIHRGFKSIIKVGGKRMRRGDFGEVYTIIWPALNKYKVTLGTFMDIQNWAHQSVKHQHGWLGKKKIVFASLDGKELFSVNSTILRKHQEVQKQQITKVS